MCAYKNFSIKYIFSVNFVIFSLYIIVMYYIHAVEFLFQNNNITSDFIFITMAQENKFIEKFNLQKGEFDL